MVTKSREFIRLSWFSLLSNLVGLVVIFSSPYWVPRLAEIDAFPFSTHLKPHAGVVSIAGGVVAIVIVVVHLGEVIYARHLCRTKKLSKGAQRKWMLQTLLFGVYSLRLLNKVAKKRV